MNINEEIEIVIEDIIYCIEVTNTDSITIEYNKMILSGGAVNGILMLGTLQYLHEKNLLKNINCFIGTSIGSGISYLLAIGYTPVEIMIKLCTSQFMEKLNNINILSLTQGYGAYDWNVIDDFLKKLTIDKIGRFLSLGELYNDFGKDVTFVTYNYTMSRTEYISHENHPNMQCLTAFRMSSNLPIIFSRFKYLNCYYLDGGMTNNFALNKLEDDDNAIAIGTKFYNVKQRESFKIHEYLYDLICKFVNKEGKINEKLEYDNCDKIILSTGDYSSINFSLSVNNKLNMFSKGYQYGKNKILEIIYFKSNLKSNGLCINDA